MADRLGTLLKTPLAPEWAEFRRKAGTDSAGTEVPWIPVHHWISLSTHPTISTYQQHVADVSTLCLWVRVPNTCLSSHTKAMHMWKHLMLCSSTSTRLWGCWHYGCSPHTPSTGRQEESSGTEISLNADFVVCKGREQYRQDWAALMPGKWKPSKSCYFSNPILIAKCPVCGWEVTSSLFWAEELLLATPAGEQGELAGIGFSSRTPQLLHWQLVKACRQSLPTRAARSNCAALLDSYL